MKKFIAIISFVVCVILPGMAQTYIQYVDSADFYIKREMWNDAERVTIAAIKLTPANKLNKYLWSNLGDIRTNLEDYPGALQAFEIGLASDPKSTAILTKRAYTYLKMNKQQEAISDINNALAIDSIMEWPLRMRAILLFSKGDYANAEKDYRSLVAHHPQNPDGYLGLGKIEAMKGDHKKSLELLKKSLDLRQDEETWFYIIMVNIEANDIANAKDELFTALKRYPRSGNLYLLRGVIHKLNYENDLAEMDKKIAVDYGADPLLVEKYFPKIRK